jgi:Fe-S oxidoreductase
MPYISYGELEKATRVAEYNLRILGPYFKSGYEIVSTEPTATYMFRDVYPKLVPGELAKLVSEHSSPFFKFLEPHLQQLTLKPMYPDEGPIGFHIACHDRGLSNGAPATSFLRRAGYVVRLVETGTCCGMGGTFGMKRGDLGYNLSVAVGERLFRLFRESGCKLIATESSVCAMQLSDGLNLDVLHPLHMIQ